MSHLRFRFFVESSEASYPPLFIVSKTEPTYFCVMWLQYVTRRLKCNKNNTQNSSDQLAHVLQTLFVISTFQKNTLKTVKRHIFLYNVQIWQLVRFRQIIRPRVDNEINFLYIVHWPKSKLWFY